MAGTGSRHGTDAYGENGPAARSFAADAHDCIMVRIRVGSTEYKCVARCSAPDGEFPSDHYADMNQRRQTPELRREAHRAVQRPSACSGVKALRNTSDAKGGKPPSCASVSVP